MPHWNHARFRASRKNAITYGLINKSDGSMGRVPRYLQIPCEHAHAKASSGPHALGRRCCFAFGSRGAGTPPRIRRRHRIRPFVRGPPRRCTDCGALRKAGSIIRARPSEDRLQVGDDRQLAMAKPELRSTSSCNVGSWVWINLERPSKKSFSSAWNISHLPTFAG